MTEENGSGLVELVSDAMRGLAQDDPLWALCAKLVVEFDGDSEVRRLKPVASSLVVCQALEARLRSSQVRGVVIPGLEETVRKMSRLGDKEVFVFPFETKKTSGCCYIERETNVLHGCVLALPKNPRVA
jgi:hypothetical protein